MPSPTEKAIEVFEYNLEALRLREVYYRLYLRNRFMWCRKVRRAAEQLQIRKAEIDEAIGELKQGQSVLAVRLLSRMAQESCVRPIGTWGRLVGDSQLFRLSPPLVPGAPNDSFNSHAFTAIVELLSDLSRLEKNR